MAKIPLRVYSKEIESLIERGEIEQAIAHAKNILKTYPKHIDTYRLLGKAFLESQRYTEAADILQRVLSVIPDDFFSQVGMSIIREDEGNLDAAIWHMERAYEVQPFNPAVQDELKRLYGRRDGIEPPKIRLTRGALIRMYTRGELYPQAIAETRAALAEDPQRPDLRVLLARLYYLSGHKNDAAGVCSELISKLPYCYEANHLLSQILPDTTRAEEAKKFQQRIYALDPYEAFLSPTAATSDQVPDQAIMIEQVADTSMPSTQAPAWTSAAGVQWEETDTQEETIPDWLNTLTPEKPAAEAPAEPDLKQTQAAFEQAPDASVPSDETSQPAESAQTQEGEVPDWMKAAGWAKTDRSADEIMAEQGEIQFEEEAVAPAEIPDWLKSIAPTEEQPASETNESGSEWFDNLMSASKDETHPAAAPDTAPASATGEEFTRLDQDNQGDVAATGPELTPDQQPAASNPAEGNELLPDWLSQLAEEAAPSEAAAQPQPAENELESLPDWAKGDELSFQEPASAGEETPDWLKSIESEKTEPPAAAEEQPDWLASLSETQAAEPQVTPESEPEKEPAVNTDWLKSLEPRFDEAETPEPASQPVDSAASAEEEPQVKILPHDETAAEPAPEQPAPEQPAAAASSGMPDLSDTDAMMAWLESLAAKQGADEATLITPADQRTETPPDWVMKEMETGQTTEEASAEPQAVVPDESAHPQETGLTSLNEIEKPTVPFEPVFDQPAEVTQEITTPPTAPEEETIPFELNDDDAASMAWMGSLNESSDAGEALIFETSEQPAETPEVTPDQVEEAAPSMIQPVNQAAQGAASETPDTFEQHLEPSISEPAADQSATEPTQPVKVAKESAQPTPPTEAEAETQPASSISEMPDYSDTDAMMAWLESLAAKQGADEATLVTPPDQRTETPPDWVMKEMETGTETVTPIPAPEPPETAPQAEAQPAPVEPVQEEVPDWLKDIEEESEIEPAADLVEPPASPVSIHAAWAPEVEPVEPPVSSAPPAAPAPTSPQVETNLKALYDALQHGEVEKALQGYSQYINNGEHLEETIRNLRDALYRYPVDISIWQTLGDAYSRNNQLQEALDAYTKAEELLR